MECKDFSEKDLYFVDRLVYMASLFSELLLHTNFADMHIYLKNSKDVETLFKIADSFLMKALTGATLLIRPQQENIVLSLEYKAFVLFCLVEYGDTTRLKEFAIPSMEKIGRLLNNINDIQASTQHIVSFDIEGMQRAQQFFETMRTLIVRTRT